MSASKLPQWLSSTYLQYKRDTTLFTSWIANQAIALGHLPPESNRLAMRVPVELLLEQARFLSETKKAQRVPKDVFNAGKAAVRERKECVQWYHLDHKSDQGHKYFIDVLEKILTFLQPLREKDSKSNQIEATITPPNNQYELLEIFEEASNHRYPSSDETEEPSGRTDVNIKKGEEERVDDTTDQEWRFRAFCTLKDFHRIRIYIMDIWKAYERREAGFELIIVAAITEVAFNMMEQMEKETLFPMVYGEERKPVDVASVLFGEWLQSQGLQDISGGDKDGKYWTKVLPSFRYLFLDVKQAVTGWQRGPWLRKTEFLEMYGTTDPSYVQEAIPAIKESKEDMMRFGYLLSGTFTACLCTGNGPPLPITMDKVTEELYALAKHPDYENTSVWLLCAVRILADINKTIRLDSGRPFKEMLVVAKLSGTMLKNHRAFLQEPSIHRFGIENWEDYKFLTLASIENVIEWIGEDKLMDAKKSSVKGCEIPADDFDLIPHAPHSQNPVLCGLVAYGITLARSTLAYVSVNAWSSAMSLACLYNVLKANQHLQQSWTGMETFIAQYKSQIIFLDGAPPTVQSSLTRLLLAKGLPLHLLSKDSRRNDKIPPRERKKIDAGRLSRISQTWLLTKYDPQGSGARILVVPLAELVCEEWAKEQDQQAELDHTQFLQGLRMHLCEKMPIFKFNIFAFNEQCVDINRGLREKFLQDFVDRDVRGHEKDSTSLTTTVESILRLASEQSYGLWTAYEERLYSGYPSFISKVAAALEAKFSKK